MIYAFSGFQAVKQAIEAGSGSVEIRILDEEPPKGVVSGFRHTDGWATDPQAIADECNRVFKGKASFSISGPYDHAPWGGNIYLLEIDPA